MAKLIKLTQEIIEETQREFSEYLNGKITDGKVLFSKTVNIVQRKATVWFTDIAYKKFQALVKSFDKEVAWHGLAYRNDDLTKDEYYITDIMVYPQEVTGATVTTDQNKYQTWLMNHDDDTFNNIRMQGHSHVNMGVTPSSVDETLYESILSQLDDTMFYIFMIWNKKGDKTCKIYDLAKNVLFDTTDCEIKIIPTPLADVKIEGVSEEEKKSMLEYLNDYRAEKICEQFVEDAKKLVISKVYNSSYSKDSYGGYGNYGNYGGYYSGYYGSSGSSASLTKNENKDVKKNDKKERRKGRRKDSAKASSQLCLYDDDEDFYGYDRFPWL